MGRGTSLNKQLFDFMVRVCVCVCVCVYVVVAVVVVVIDLFNLFYFWCRPTCAPNRGYWPIDGTLRPRTM
jgi:hypothetical protein